MLGSGVPFTCIPPPPSVPQQAGHRWGPLGITTLTCVISFTVIPLCCMDSPGSRCHLWQQSINLTTKKQLLVLFVCSGSDG